MQTITIHEIILSQGTLRYREVGEGPILLFLHGWGVDASTFGGVMQRLGSIRRCIALDLPGFGGSFTPDRAWTVADYATLVRDFLEKMDITICDVLAHSFGGRITLELLVDDPGMHRFQKVLITGGAGMKPRRSLRFYLRKYAAKTMKAPFTLLPEPLRAKGLHWLRNTSAWKSLGSSDYQKLDGVMRQTFVNTVNYYQEALLAKIPHDILLLWGVDDTATPLYQAERMEKGLRSAALVKIEKAGHYAFLDQPGSFGAIAEAYFKA
jgi:pimeloyl-ACP methyl ester carboxylesterase